MKEDRQEVEDIPERQETTNLTSIVEDDTGEEEDKEGGKKKKTWILTECEGRRTTIQQGGE